MPGADLCCDGNEAARQLLDRLIGQIGLEPVAQALARDQPRAGEVEVEIPEHLPACELARKAFQGIENPGGVATADNSSDRGPSNDVRLDAGSAECAQHTDVRPAAGRPTAQCNADLAVSHCLFPKSRLGSRI